MLIKIAHIYYLVQIDQNEIWALFNNRSEVNAINPNYSQKLGFEIWKTSIKVQKTVDFALETFKIVNTDFQIKNKFNKHRFFKKTFLFANIKVKVVFKKFILKPSNINVLFWDKISTSKLYFIKNTFIIIK